MTGRLKKRILATTGIGMLLIVLLLMPRRWMVHNDITTGRTPAYSEIVPHLYTEPPERAYAATRDAMLHMARWRIVYEEPEARRLQAEIRVFLFGFTDDVSVWIEPSGAGSRVMIRSHSRVGKGDLGENSRTIRALQHEMDRRLTRVRAR